MNHYLLPRDQRLWAGRPGFSSRQGQWWDIFLFDTFFRPTLRPTQPTIEWAPGVLSPGVKRPGR